MTRTSPSKTTTQAQPSPAAPQMPQMPQMPQTAADRAAHRQKIRALPPGTPVAIVMPNRPVLTGLVLIDPCWSQVEAIVRTKRGDGVRVPIVHLHEAFSCSRLDRIGEEAPAAPAAEPQA